eukprot:CAMPEP_0197845724 /NCGR_PEP_ID=MMETSP1438-20131217/2615_1 /TAXON_ID=1461541 /ORGANISM="Pterosperma sp., Strain CCMP1384" /LENGTH=72 /DNA_ID=CAMNT_0043457125 /DNA_START=110 /DNA_END=328 /DNA_ORIENTATION=+
MGKVPTRLNEVVYTLSPHAQNVMPGLWSNMAYKVNKKFSEKWLDVLTLTVPIIGLKMYCDDFKEKEKLDHRF